MLSTGEDVSKLKSSELAVLLAEKAESYRKLANFKDGLSKVEVYTILDSTKLDSAIATAKDDLAQIVTAVQQVA